VRELTDGGRTNGGDEKGDSEKLLEHGGVGGATTGLIFPPPGIHTPSYTSFSLFLRAREALCHACCIRSNREINCSRLFAPFPKEEYELPVSFKFSSL
jgi:hypothetical protein